MLQNAYLLAKIGADTAENERKFAEHLPKVCQKCTTATQDALEKARAGGADGLGRADGQRVDRAVHVAQRGGFEGWSVDQTFDGSHTFCKYFQLFGSHTHTSICFKDFSVLHEL